MSLLTLPNDILKELLKYLNGNSLLALGATSKHFYDLTNGADVWEGLLKELNSCDMLSSEYQKNASCKEKWKKIIELRFNLSKGKCYFRMIDKRYFGHGGFVTDGIHAVSLHRGYREMDLMKEKMLAEKSHRDSEFMSIPKHIQGDYIYGYDIFKSLHKKTWGGSTTPLHTSLPQLATYVESRLILDSNPTSDPNKILVFQSSRKTPGYFLIYNLISFQVERDIINIVPPQNNEISMFKYYSPYFLWRQNGQSQLFNIETEKFLMGVGRCENHALGEKAVVVADGMGLRVVKFRDNKSVSARIAVESNHGMEIYGDYVFFFSTKNILKMWDYEKSRINICFVV